MPTSVQAARREAEDQAVLLDRAADGAELEIGPFATSRGARWTRAETLLGVGLVAILFGGALINGIANPGPKPTPSPNTVVAAVECTPASEGTALSRARLRPVGESSGSTGRTGNATDRDLAKPDDWLLPRPNEGLEIGLGTPLEAISGETCVVGFSLWVVPTVDVLVNAEATMTLLGSGAFEPTAASIPVPGPVADGDWTVRLATAYQTEANKTRWSVKFFRVLVGGAPYQTPVPPTPRPTPVPTPAITPAVPCGPPSASGGPPIVFLVAAGQEPIAGTTGASTWFGEESAPVTIPVDEGPTIPFEGDLEVRIAGDVCATRWDIASMQMPQGETTINVAAFPATSWTSFIANRSDNPIISQQNRIATKPVGLGRIAVRAMLSFEGGQHIESYWLVKVGAFPTPPIRVVGPDSTAITPIVGCGVSISTNDNWFGEECPPGSWPALDDTPVLVVHAGDIVRLETPDWPLTSWYARWTREADVASGAEVPDVGNLGGQDTLQPGLIRWLVPPAGEWAAQFLLTHQEGDRWYNLPLHIRLHVLP